MPTVTIDQLSPADAPSGAELVPVSQGERTKSMPIDANGPACLPNVAAMSAAKADRSRIFLDGYLAAGDGGGGLLVHDVASARADNFGTVFPAVIGKYTRPVAATLHTKWFGINHAGLGDQSGRAQSFLNACIENHYAGHIDPGIIECAGATLFFNSTGTLAGKVIVGEKLTGNERTRTLLRNCLLSVGQVGGIGGSGDSSANVSLECFQILAGLDLWSLEQSSRIDRVRVLPTAICTDGCGLLVHACNHLTLFGVRAESGLSAGLNGARIIASQNTLWMHGGAPTNVKGIIFTELLTKPKYVTGDFTFTTTASQNTELFHTHFEGMREECMVLDRVAGVIVRGAHVRSGSGTTRDFTKPMIRVGDTARSIQAQNVDLRDFYVTGRTEITPRVGTCIGLERVDGISIDGIRANAHAIVIDGSAMTAAVANIDIGRNDYGDSTNPVLLNTSTTFARKPDRVLTPTSISGTTLIWDAAKGQTATTKIGAAGRSFPAPSNLQAGQSYRVTITKSAMAGSITGWDPIFQFAGSAPDFASMTTTQSARLDLYYDGTILQATVAEPFGA